MKKVLTYTEKIERERVAIEEWQAMLDRVKRCLSQNPEYTSWHFECIDILLELVYIIRLHYTGQEKFYQPKKK